VEIVVETKPSLDELIHYGVKGMRWGIRKEEGGIHRFESSQLHIDPDIHPATKNAAVEVTNLVRDRYGYDINSVKTIGPDHPEYPGTLAYVENLSMTAGAVAGTIHVQKNDLTAALKTTETDGWMAPGTGNVKALLTHECAHSVFHSDQKLLIGFGGRQKRVGSKVKALDKAFAAAVKVGKKDRIGRLIDISGYARASGSLPELEAEMFSSYHWGTNPPRYVVAWGETLHKELGVDPTPFKEVK
jgi:hypothetical protein